MLHIQVQYELYNMLFSVMDGSLPKSLRHIISNAEYYGPSLFLLGKSLDCVSPSALCISVHAIMACSVVFNATLTEVISIVGS